MNSRKEQVHIPELYAAKTDVGNVREHNEDSFAAKSPLFVVADGMGGHEAGEVASEIAVNTMLANVPDGPDPNALAEAVKAANRAVLRGAQDGTGKPGMGTTMTAAIIYGDELVIAQVGDSRAYLLHEGSLQRITRDHSLVADLVEQGRITEEEARYHPQRSVITRALGSDPRMEPDTYRLRVVPDDRLLICSDGLSSMITDASIEAIMLANPDPENACEALVQEALAAGGYDNVTALVVDPFGSASEDDENASDKTAETKAQSFQKQPSKPQKEEKKRSKKGRKAPLIWAIVFIAIILVAILGFNAYAQHSYYLIDEGGYVVVYRGLPGSFGGLKFSWEEENTGLAVSELPPTTASRLEHGISVDSRDAADQLVESYRKSIMSTTTVPEASTSTDTSGQ